MTQNMFTLISLGQDLENHNCPISPYMMSNMCIYHVLEIIFQMKMLQVIYHYQIPRKVF